MTDAHDVPKARDVFVVLLGQILLSINVDKRMTVGQAADLFLKQLKKEGYELTHDRQR